VKSWIIIILLVFSNALLAKQSTANLDQIDFYDGNKFKFVAATDNYTYPSNQLAKMIVKVFIENVIISNRYLEKAEIRLELVQETPESDSYNDGFSQMHCSEFSIVELLEAWVKSKGINGYNKMNIKVELPKSELRINPIRPPWECFEYKAPSLEIKPSFLLRTPLTKSKI
jgi:hypothetical protein